MLIVLLSELVIVVPFTLMPSMSTPAVPLPVIVTLEFVVNEAAIRAVRRVSSQLNQGKEPKAVTPQVTAEDFEASVANYYATRKPGGGAGGVGQSLINALTK